MEPQPGRSDTPTLWLKDRHSLKGKDVLPIAIRLSATSADSVTEWASTAKKYPLTTFDEKDIEKQFLMVTGYEVAVSSFFFLGYAVKGAQY